MFAPTFKTAKLTKELMTRRGKQRKYVLVEFKQLSLSQVFVSYRELS